MLEENLELFSFLCYLLSMSEIERDYKLEHEIRVDLNEIRNLEVQEYKKACEIFWAKKYGRIGQEKMAASLSVLLDLGHINHVDYRVLRVP